MKYRVPGKLMISGEYAVLNGAKALAIPTGHLGQSLEVKQIPEQDFIWQSYDPSGQWFEARFSGDLNLTKNTSNKAQAVVIQQLLQYIKQYKPHLFETPLSFETHLNFDRLWGLGSSSSLIALLSQWSGVPAYELLDISFGGSGYDVAVALTNQAVLYQLQKAVAAGQQIYRNYHPVWQAVDFNPPFSNDLFLVYLNQKQNSREEIKKYQSRKITPAQIDSISEISEAMVQTGHLSDFETLIDRHESIISNILQRPTIKQQLFDDYPGHIKSLGAWGGDFILATGQTAPGYFKNKGYPVILNFKTFLPV